MNTNSPSSAVARHSSAYLDNKPLGSMTPETINNSEISSNPAQKAVDEAPAIRQLDWVDGYDDSERLVLQKWEREVELGVNAGMNAARSLYKIYDYKDGLFWRHKYKTFEGYCLERWHYRKSHAYRLRDTGEFINDLEHAVAQRAIPQIGEWPRKRWFPRNEFQLRGAMLLPKQERIAFWGELVIAEPVGRLSGVEVAKKAGEYARRNKLATRCTHRIPSSDMRAEKLLDALQKITRSRSNAKQVQAMIAQLRELLRIPDSRYKRFGTVIASQSAGTHCREQ